MASVSFSSGFELCKRSLNILISTHVFCIQRDQFNNKYGLNQNGMHIFEFNTVVIVTYTRTTHTQTKYGTLAQSQPDHGSFGLIYFLIKCKQSAVFTRRMTHNLAKQFYSMQFIFAFQLWIQKFATFSLILLKKKCCVFCQQFL